MIIYYGEFNNELLVKPKPVISLLKDVQDKANLQIKRCPAFIDFYKNTYAVYPTFDYTLVYDSAKQIFESPDYTQDVFNSLIRVRDKDSGAFSYVDPLLCFVTDESSLILEQLPLAYPFDAPRYSIIPGEFDIGKHVRPLELACQAEPNVPIEFKRDKPIYLVKFKTAEKIIFKRFIVTDAFKSLMRATFNLRDRLKFRKPLSFYYKLSEEYKLKKQLLNLAKQNVVE